MKQLIGIAPKVVDYFDTSYQPMAADEELMAKQEAQQTIENLPTITWGATGGLWTNPEPRVGERWGGRRVRRPLDVVYLNESAAWRFVIRVAKRQRQLERWNYR
jgi:hypothetical protein